LWIINTVTDVLTTTCRRKGPEGVCQRLQLVKEILSKPRNRQRDVSRGVEPEVVKMLPVAENR
jgi:hypothetical protein